MQAQLRWNRWNSMHWTQHSAHLRILFAYSVCAADVCAVLLQGDERLTGTAADVRLEPVAIALSPRSVALLRTCLTFEQQRPAPPGISGQQQQDAALGSSSRAGTPKAGGSPKGESSSQRPSPPDEQVSCLRSLKFHDGVMSKHGPAPMDEFSTL